MRRARIFSAANSNVETLEAIFDALGDSPDRRLAPGSAHALVYLTGTDQARHAPWLRWWRENRKGFELEKAPPCRGRCSRRSRFGARTASSRDSGDAATGAESAAHRPRAIDRPLVRERIALDLRHPRGALACRIRTTRRSGRTHEDHPPDQLARRLHLLEVEPQALWAKGSGLLRPRPRIVVGSRAPTLR